MIATFYKNVIDPNDFELVGIIYATDAAGMIFWLIEHCPSHRLVREPELSPYFDRYLWQLRVKISDAKERELLRETFPDIRSQFNKHDIR